MSPEDLPTTGGSDSCSADLAAYALGALEPDEATAFVRHLQTCAVCPVELVAFQQVVNDLAISAPPLRAPREVKRRVMDAVDADPRLQDADRRARRGLRERFAMPPRLAFSGGLVAVAAVAAAVVLLVSGGSSGQRTIAAQVTGSGTVSLHIANGQAQMVLHHFAAPPSGKIYEVWLQHDSGSISPTTALFSVDHHGDGAVDVPGSLHGVSHVLVTPEPDGGTSQPTVAPIISAKL